VPDLRFAPVGQHLKPVMAADERDLLLAMEQNLAERVCHLHRELAGATVIRADDLVIADSGLDDDTFNIVAAARFTPRTAGRRIAETVMLLESTGRTFAWWVGPTSTAAGPGGSADRSRPERIGKRERHVGKDQRAASPSGSGGL
jgi:hypothetical protein